MFKIEPELYLSEQDPNYRIKGSRDPLGFQTVWSRVGRHLIRHISSVSSGVRDFQTLLYARFFLDHIGGDTAQLIKFFLKFEQASGYSRRLNIGIDDAFNGSEYINKVIASTPDVFYCSTTDQLLSNQKSYGIWGKYSRPFRDIDFVDQASSQALLPAALIEKTDFQEICSIIKRIYYEERVALTRGDLKTLSKLYLNLTEDEVVFFRNNLLRVPDETHLQNEFYDLLIENPNLIPEKSFHLFHFIESALSIPDISIELRKCLESISASETVLFRLNSMFRGLQTRSAWTSTEINGDEELKQFNHQHGGEFLDSELNELNSYFAESVFNTAENIAHRNKEICDRRRKANWVVCEGHRLKVYYREGASRVALGAFDNSYFIECYISLFKQIERPVQ